MSFVRVDKTRENPYIQIYKHAIDSDSRISWAAKGLLTYLIGKPDDWRIQITDLINRASNGRDSVMTIINELIEAGYMRREQERSDDGTMQPVSYTVFETPTHSDPIGKPDKRKKRKQPQTDIPEAVELVDNSPQTDIPETDNPEADEPEADNPIHSNNELSELDLRNDYLDKNINKLRNFQGSLSKAFDMETTGEIAETLIRYQYPLSYSSLNHAITMTLAAIHNPDGSCRNVTEYFMICYFNDVKKLARLDANIAEEKRRSAK